MTKRILAGVRCLAVFVYLRQIETRRRGRPWYTLEVVVVEQTNAAYGSREVETVLERSLGSYKADQFQEAFEERCEQLQSRIVAKGAGQWQNWRE